MIKAEVIGTKGICNRKVKGKTSIALAELCLLADNILLDIEEETGEDFTDIFISSLLSGRKH